MNIEQIREYCLAKPLVTEDSAFGPEGILFRFFNKIFAYIDLEKPDLVVAKCDPDYAIELRDRYTGIKGAWHWNKKHWNEIHFDSDVPDALILELIDHSFNEIVKSLPKKTLYHFPDLPKGWTHRHLPSLSSTMDYLRQADETDSPFLLVTTDHQTAGRGQRGTHWEAAPAQNLLLGFRFSPLRVSAQRQFLLSEALALAVHRSLEKYAGKGIRIKWPNDIYYHDRKICGMLLEHDLCGTEIATTITGVGINVNQREFRSNAPNPVSLYQILGKEVDRSAILRNLLKHFTENYALLLEGKAEKIEQAYFSKLYRTEGLHAYRDANGTFKARITRVAADGRITLTDENGQERAYAFKEVAFVGEGLPVPAHPEV